MSISILSFILYGVRLPYDPELENLAENNKIQYYVDGARKYIFLGESLSQVWNSGEYTTMSQHGLQEFYSDEDSLYSDLKKLFSFEENDFGLWHVVTAYV